MVGGATFAEAREVALMNASNTGVRIVLGGTSILNSECFLTEVGELSKGSVGKGSAIQPLDLGKADRF